MKYAERNSAIPPSQRFHMPANTIINPAKISQPSLTASLSAIDSEYMMLVSTPRLSMLDMLSPPRSTRKLAPRHPASLTRKDCGRDHGNTGRNGADEVTSPRSSPTASEPAARAHAATVSTPQMTATRDKPTPSTVSWTLSLSPTQR